MRRTSGILGGLSCLLTGCFAFSTACFPGDTPGHGSPVAGLATGVVRIGDDAFHVKIADTPASRTRGLMERTTLAEDEGMLFVFEDPGILSFWMFNTPLPLDIAFIRDNMTVSSIDTMEPFTLDSHRSIEPVLFALEVPAGEFATRNIQPGDSVEFEGIVTTP